MTHLGAIHPCVAHRSLKTVVVTLWGATAEGPGRELEEQGGAAPVVAISSCRVSSYNGVSGTAVLPPCCTSLAHPDGLGEHCIDSHEQVLLESAINHLHSSCSYGAVSSLQRSAVLINPDLPEAAALRQWWESTGCSAATSHVGEGLATAIK